ncbi:MAG: metal ABC transporter permease [Candidatus Riflebacteria bacterium]|nr:metal ABC transporter permease [Candidatus Riflebacteria bacterium]
MNESFLTLAKFFHVSFYVVIVNALALSISGLFLYQRRSLFMGAALPQIAGFALIFVSIFTESALAGFLAVIALCVYVLSWQSSKTRFKIEKDAFIGVAFVTSMAGSLLIMAMSNTETHGYDMLFKGGILAAMPNDFWRSALICIPAFICLIVFRKRLLAINMMPIQAELSGINKGRIFEYIQFIAISAVIAVSLENLGVMGTFAFLLFPMITGLTFAKSAASLFLILPIVGIVAGISGLSISIKFDLPAGPSIIAALFVIWLASGFLSFFAIYKKR